MRWQTGVCTISIFLAFLLGFCIIESVRADTIKVGGTGFGLGVMKILAESFEATHPEEKIEVVPSLGSSGGIKALAHGALDVAISGRPLKESESHGGLEAREFTRTPFIFIVNTSISKKEITLKELEGIYGGNILTWPDGSRARPVLRPESDTMTRVVRSLSHGMDEAVSRAMAREGMILAITDQESAETVEKIPGALAAATLTQMYSEKRQVGILTLNNVMPSVQSLSDGSYPLSVSLYLVTDNRSGETTHDFLKFLHSSEGRRILKANGNLVVEPGKAR